MTQVLIAIFTTGIMFPKGITLLFEKCETQELAVKLSLLNVEEMCSLYLKNKELGKKQLAQILKFVDLSELVRYPDMIINEAFENIDASIPKHGYYLRDYNVLQIYDQH